METGWRQRHPVERLSVKSCLVADRCTLRRQPHHGLAIPLDAVMSDTGFRYLVELSRLT